MGGHQEDFQIETLDEEGLKKAEAEIKKVTEAKAPERTIED